MPDIDKINNVAVASISKIDSITFAHGQKVNNQDVSLVTDNHVLIAENVDFTNESTVTFSSLETGTYEALMFQFINIHSDDNDKDFRFASTESDDYQLSTYWEMEHVEDDSAAGSSYESGEHTSMGSGGSAGSETAIAKIARNFGDVSDEAGSGFLWLYGLNNTNSLIKHWWAEFDVKAHNEVHYFTKTGGGILHDGNSTQAVTGIEFTMDSGNFDGTIKLFGLAEA